MTKEKVVLSNAIFVNGFAQELKELMEQRLRPFSAFAAADFAKQFDEKSKVFFDAKENTLKKYQDEEGKFIEEKEEEANKDFQELLNIEIEFEMMKKIKVTDGDDLKLKPQTVLMLESILEVTE